MSSKSFSKAAQSRFFGVVYKPQLEPTKMTKTFLDWPQHPLYRMFKDRFDKRDKDSLWQVFSGYTINAPPILAHKACRKLRLAFTLVMSRHGYTRFGKPLSGNGASLKGTVEFYPHRTTVLASQDELERDMGKVIKQLILEQKKNFYQRGKK